jgi:GT2 family glycosyltransferase
VKPDVALAALVVNYNTGSYAVGCVESLLAEWRRAGGARENLTLVCVENASPEDQEPFLAELEGLGVDVVRSAENLGYARGMNLAWERARAGARGRRPDLVAILNPDLYFLPGSLAALVDYVLEHREVGCVDPATCVDPLGVFHLPRNLLPTPLEHWRVTLAQMHPWFCRAYSRYRTRRALEWWTATGPIATDMLSGCCLVLRGEVVERLGQPMDPRYPLYFEDTDLFRTLRDLGYAVVHHAGVRILHHWSRSARVGRAFEDEPTRRFEASKRAYYAKFYGPLGRAAVAAIEAVARRWPARWLSRPPRPLTDLGEFAEPLTLALPRRARFLLEFSVHPTFVICAGVFGEGERWTCPREAWEWLFRLQYYVRAVDLDTLGCLGTWRFVKAADGRDRAMGREELAAYGERLVATSDAPGAAVR